MGFPRLRGGELWTHRARSEKVARCQLGESFEVRTIMWRLSKILPQLVRATPHHNIQGGVLTDCL